MELETCQGLRSNRLRLGLYRLEATQRFVVRVQEVFPCTLPRGERGCGQRPRCWQDPWGSRSRGQVCRRHSFWGSIQKTELKPAKECSIQQRRGFACGVCRWKRRFGCSRNSAVSAARFESGFRERDGQGQHWRGPHSHGGFLKMIVCESGGHANGLTYFIFRFLRRPHFKGFGVLGLQGTEPALCSLAWLSGDRWAHVASVAKAAPCALRPLSLDNLQVLVQSLLWPLAEPFQPKLGLSLYERLMPIFTPSRIIPN